MTQPERQLADVPPAGHPGVEVLSRARDLERGDRLDEAAALLEPFVIGPGASPDALYRLACVRARQQRPVDAEDLLRRAVRMRQEDARIHTNLGVVLDMQGRAEEAVRSFRRALELSPDDPTVLLNLGAIYGEMGRHDDAARVLERCRTMHPGYEPSFNLAIVRMRQGALQESATLLSEAVGHDPRSAVAWFYLGRTRAKLGRSREAIDALERALEIEPELVQARVTLGIAWNALGAPRAAVRELEMAAKAWPDEGKIHYHLGIAHDALAEKARARECYRRARTCGH